MAGWARLTFWLEEVQKTLVFTFYNPFDNTENKSRVSSAGRKDSVCKSESFSFHHDLEFPR